MGGCVGAMRRLYRDMYGFTMYRYIYVCCVWMGEVVYVMK